ncbi:MAG: 2-oxoacid:acceptor oxidoreductase subunit alpha [Rhodocyclales bacterium CG_4_9_14_3_um_filter_68_10]|nr:MAG: 2-oxoacid:acceptor oxidoreductase subunit alpha [Rhodocyclales bacterium CG_4_9_14_3_um_filter_68_10]
MKAMSTDIQIAICGSAGDGTIAAGEILRNVMAGLGYKVIAFDVYPPEIRGFGKCIARMRVTTEQAYSLKPQSDVLISLDDSHAIPHVGEVRDYGAVIYERGSIVQLAEGGHISAHVRPAQLPYAVPLRELSEKSTSSNRSRNIVALGFLAGLCGLQEDTFLNALSRKFKKKPEVAESAQSAFRAGYAESADTFKLDDVVFGPVPKAPVAAGSAVEMMNGNAAVVRGCLDAGIENYFGYPITPATSIMERLALEMPKRGARLLQTEDEIAAISATVGAGFAGARAATATSGPGFSLMTEMLGLGVIAEVPCVIFVSQRGGPSTGMPTKTEQSDLHIAVYGGHGDAQRIVIAPTNVEGCYRCAGKAFEMAERYQTPVVVLLDLYLSNRYETVVFPARPPFAPNQSKAPEKDQLGDAYRRYALTDDLISPRTVPGDKDGMYVATGLEHNELGRPNDQPQNHEAQSRKRHEKLKAALAHPDFTHYKRFGDEGAVDVGIIGWGSNFGECLEAMIKARAEGIRCAAMKVVMISPFPVAGVTGFMDQCREVLVPEVNYEGQFANVLQANVGRPVARLNRVPGAPMAVGDILEEVRRLAARARRGHEKAAA